MDIDGTLLNSKSEISERNSETIAEAAARGIEIVLVTGRRFDFALPIANALPCDLHLIVNNGALAKSRNGTTHLRYLLPAETARQVLAATPEFRGSAAVIFDRPGARQVIMERVDWDDPFRGGYFRRNREYIAEVAPLGRLFEWQRGSDSGDVRGKLRADAGGDEEFGGAFAGAGFYFGIDGV